MQISVKDKPYAITTTFFSFFSARQNARSSYVVKAPLIQHLDMHNRAH